MAVGVTPRITTSRIVRIGGTTSVGVTPRITTSRIVRIGRTSPVLSRTDGRRVDSTVSVLPRPDVEVQDQNVQAVIENTHIKGDKL